MSIAHIIKDQLGAAYQGHLKLVGRTPGTLGELQQAYAEQEQRRRAAELKAIAPKLAQLDAFVPALAERGISLVCRTFSTWDGGKSLRLQDHVFTKDNQLLDALLALGFKEVERKDAYRDEETVKIKHGRSLVLVLTVRKPGEAEGGTA
jgi:hypothetical protein